MNQAANTAASPPITGPRTSLRTSASTGSSTGSSTGPAQPQLRRFFRLAIAAVAAGATGAVAYAAPAPVGGAGVATKPTAGVPIVLLGSRAVAVTDTITADGESIRFAGQAIVTAQLIDDVVTKAPRVLQLVIDFTGVTATGVSSGRHFMTTAHGILHRAAKPFDMVEVSFPYYVSGDMRSARTAMAAFSVGLDGAALRITSKLSTPS